MEAKKKKEEQNQTKKTHTHTIQHTYSAEEYIKSAENNILNYRH